MTEKGISIKKYHLMIHVQAQLSTHPDFVV